MRGGKNKEGYCDPTATVAIGRVDKERRKKQKQKKRGKLHRCN